MKKTLFTFMLCAVTALFCACSSDSDDGGPGIVTYPVTLQLDYGQQGVAPVAGTTVTFKSESGTVYNGLTDSRGAVTINLPAGIYSVIVSDIRSGEAFNGVTSRLVVAQGWNPSTPVQIEMIRSNISDIVIKELYVGGVQKDDGSGAFNFGQYVILYNNSENPVTILPNTLSLAVALPYNSNGTNLDYRNGASYPYYQDEGWVPAGMGVWSFRNDVVLQAGEQIVVAINSAIDNTLTYSNAINFDNSEYYTCYDLPVYNHALYYPAPTSIPSSHWLQAHHFGTGSAWAPSFTGPAFFIFQPQGTALQAFIDDATTTDLYDNRATQIRKKVKTEWVVDGVEVFNGAQATNFKRLTPAVDAGYITMTAKNGYSLYRNVDQTATEAIASNAGKLVYSYTGGAEGTTDPSGIDAEASIANGARIVYKDTNNSSVDFHQRGKASLRN